MCPRTECVCVCVRIKIKLPCAPAKVSSFLLLKLFAGQWLHQIDCCRCLVFSTHRHLAIFCVAKSSRNQNRNNRKPTKADGKKASVRASLPKEFRI